MATWERLLFVLAGLVALLAVLWTHLNRSLSAVLLLDDMLDSIQGAKSFNTKDNVYLQGNYYPVEDESRDVSVKVISGAVPEDLEGIFLRIGPNPIAEHGLTKRYHWFDGHGNYL